MCSIPDVADALQSVLHTKANALARESGFVKRASKLTGALFVQTLVFTWLSHAQASLEQMAQTAAARGLSISAQGLEQRFTEAAATPIVFVFSLPYIIAPLLVLFIWGAERTTPATTIGPHAARLGS